MKKTLFSVAIIALLAACNNAPEADQAATGEKETAAAAQGATYLLDTAASVITWHATKANGEHTGTFKIKDGSLAVKDGLLTGGKFTIDATSMKNSDLAGDAENQQKLEGHLKSADFLDVAKYPTAVFEITGVTPFTYDSTTMKDVVLKSATHTIKGNLTLKDSTKNVSFPAVINIAETGVTAEADFNIDRTDWGINYKGPNNPQDWFIRKTVNLKLKVAATKQ